MGVAGLDSPFQAGIVPNIQPGVPLVQLEAVSSCPVPCFLEKRWIPTLLSFQGVVESWECQKCSTRSDQFRMEVTSGVHLVRQAQLR